MARAEAKLRPFGILEGLALVYESQNRRAARRRAVMLECRNFWDLAEAGGDFVLALRLVRPPDKTRVYLAEAASAGEAVPIKGAGYI